MRLTIALTDIPKDRFEGRCGMTNVRVGKQRGDELIDARPPESPRHTIEYEVEVRTNKKGAPDFFGKEVFGTSDRRFLYAQWVGDAPGLKSKMFRRLKIDLNGIDLAKRQDHEHLAVDVLGVDKKGCPACATAQIGTWRVAR